MAERPALHRSFRRAVATRATPVRCSRVLILEPDELARWSLSTYLRRWFDTRVAGSLDEAVDLLGTFAVDALIVSGEVDPTGLDRIEVAAQKRSPDALMIRTVTRVSDTSGGGASRWVELEKPFDLAALAELLGVAATPSPSTASRIG